MSYFPRWDFNHFYVNENDVNHKRLTHCIFHMITPRYLYSILCILPWTFVSSMWTHLTFRSGKMDTIWEVDSVSVVDNISIRIPGQAENMIRLYNNGNMSNKSLKTTTLDYPLGRIVLKPCSSLQWMLVSPSQIGVNCTAKHNLVIPMSINAMVRCPEGTLLL